MVTASVFNMILVTHCLFSCSNRLVLSRTFYPFSSVYRKNQPKCNKVANFNGRGTLPSTVPLSFATEYPDEDQNNPAEYEWGLTESFS